ncbi:alpha/beta fold hydrolase [Candidatus Contubernalis alkaliaceticus]|uniref:alpha/beta fold hydrolase n=1 Tax=Candidatus Contubernalis alkaliaceticus TaxID=338645 RepID=UPI001F4C090B|nr:alpha/beta hydrolase [Candidatus Contubernalis alkalaceticus]UNC90638.1 alpha/beta hydrolase [Candidatus Contubernalis alkalaceticus]
MSKKRNSTGKKILLFLLFVLVFFSLLPYVIPLGIPEQQVSAEEIAYENSNFLMVDGVNIHYRLWKPTLDPRGNVLLVHGLGGSTFSWRHNVMPLVEEGYQVMAVDLPGFGLSERGPGSADSQRWVEQLLYLIDSIEENSIWHLVGHSMGGGVATAMALEQPEKFSSLVLVCGAVYPPPLRFLLGLLQFPPAQRWLALLVNRGLLSPEGTEDLLASAYGRTPSPDEVEGYYLPLTIKGTEITMVELNTGTTVDMAVNLAERLGEVKQEAIIIWGENDSWVPLMQGERLAGDLPWSELVIIPEAAHCPMETHVNEFNRFLLDFLQRINPEA